MKFSNPENYLPETKERMSAKIIVLGNTLVGKTSIICRYVNDTFKENKNQVTIGMDYLVKKVELDDLILKMEFWDTAGQERFRSVIQQYYVDSLAVIVVFDLTDPKSFKDLDFWTQQISGFFEEEVIRFLLGNKSDMEDNIKISKEEIEEFSKKNKFQYFETSAKMNKGLHECFGELAVQIKEKFYKYKKNSFDAHKLTLINPKEGKKGKEAKREGFCC